MSAIKCVSCDRQKHELKEKPSKILPGMQFLMCNECISKGWEPRWAVVMAGQQFGGQHVREFVTKHRYAGDKIFLEEVV